MAKESEKFYADLAKDIRVRLGISDEDAGIFTEMQTKLLRTLAEGYPLWEIGTKRKGSEWSYRFDFKHGKVVWLSASEITGLKDHIDFFTEVGLCGLTPDLLRTVELDVAYEESKLEGEQPLLPEDFFDG